MIFLNNAKLVKLGNDSEVLLMKLNGSIVYQKGRVPLYVPYEFKNKTELTEIKTRVLKAHTDLSYMFDNCKELISIKDVSDWNTSNVTTMHNMFYYCQSLTSLDLSNWDTSNVTVMWNTFSGCQSLASLNISNWDTSKVTNMYGMFSNCSNLETLDLSNWDVSNVIEMQRMFNCCYKLVSLDLSNWDMNKIGFTNIGGVVADRSEFMFTNCYLLRKLILDKCNKDTIKKIIISYGLPVGTLNGITRKIYCDLSKIDEELISLLPDGWEFKSMADIEEPEPEIPENLYLLGQFRGSDITSVDTLVNESHTDLSYMFYNCDKLLTVDATDWNTSNVTTMENMFHNCHSLTTLNLSHFDTSKVENMSNMFDSCDSLQTLNLSGWDMTNVTNTENMFNGCEKLKTLRLDNCDNATIKKIMSTSTLPTGKTPNGQTRYVYCKEENFINATYPEGWKPTFV